MDLGFNFAMKNYLFLIAILFFINSCSEQSTSNAPADGKTIYSQQCSICHGDDGRLGAAGAKDLSVSTMDLNERISIIKQGKNGMPALQGMISNNEINNVAEFIATLRK